MFKGKSRYVVFIGCGALVAALLACSAGGQATSGGSGATAPSGGGDTQAAASDPLSGMDPCAILTQDDATAFFGAPSPAGTASKGNPAFCVYQTADGSKQLSLHIVYLPAAAATSDAFVAASKGVQAVPGLGDAAYFNAVMNEIGVAKGPWSFTVDGILQDGKAPLDALMTPAKAALGRLP